MSDPELILDYASPRRRGGMRLPVESQIQITYDRDSTTVSESLKGRNSAIVAIIFAVFVLSVLLNSIVSELMLWRSHPAGGPEVSILLSVLWCTEATLGIFVLDRTYRRTVIRVSDGEMKITFSATLLLHPSPSLADSRNRRPENRANSVGLQRDVIGGVANSPHRRRLNPPVHRPLRIGGAAHRSSAYARHQRRARIVRISTVDVTDPRPITLPA